jgi:hypothetical protein
MLVHRGLTAGAIVQLDVTPATRALGKSPTQRCHHSSTQLDDDYTRTSSDPYRRGTLGPQPTIGRFRTQMRGAVNTSFASLTASDPDRCGGAALGSIRSRLASGVSGWLVLAAGMRLASAIAYVLVFRAIFCPHMSWRLSYQIAVTEKGVDAVVPAGGVGGLATVGGVPIHAALPFALVYGLSATLATASVLVYHAIALGCRCCSAP